MSVLRTAGVVLFAVMGLAGCGPQEQDPSQPQTTGDVSASNCPVDPEVPCGGGGGGGGGPVSTPASISTNYAGTPSTSFRPSNVPMYPLGSGRPEDACRQSSYVQMNFSNPLHANATVFFSGVVAPSTKANVHIYDSQGNLVKTHQTNFSHDNCVITQEYEYDNLGNLAAGTYDVYVSFWYIGVFYNSGWYSNGNLGPLAYQNTFMGSITVQ